MTTYADNVQEETDTPLVLCSSQKGMFLTEQKAAMYTIRADTVDGKQNTQRNRKNTCLNSFSAQ